MNYASAPRETSSSSQFSNVTRLLRRLELENVGVPELRSLKQEHQYLERLHLQRLKIEELREKHMQTEQSLQAMESQSNAQQELIEHQQRIIKELQMTIDTQRGQIDQVREERTVQIQSLMTKMTANADRQEALENQNSDLKTLVSRQSQALKVHTEQFEALRMRHQQGRDELQRHIKMNNSQASQLSVVLKRLADSQQMISTLKQQLVEQRQSHEKREQLQELRKRMYEMTKGEIQKIEFIVNDME